MEGRGVEDWVVGETNIATEYVEQDARYFAGHNRVKFAESTKLA